MRVSGPQITEARMPIERENESARRADWSAARRAGAAAWQGGPRGVGNDEDGKDAPERQETPASSGTKLQGGWEERYRGERRLAQMRRARGPLSFGGLRGRKQFRQKKISRDASYPLYLDCATRSDLAPFPAQYRRLIHRRREQLAKRLKTHLVVARTEFRDLGFSSHGSYELHKLQLFSGHLVARHRNALQHGLR